MTTSVTDTKKAYQQPSLVAFGSVRNLTGGSQEVGTDSPLPQNKKSDRRYKDNIVQVGTHPAGFPLYLFDYKAEFADLAGLGRQFGVMADEVETVVPAAVTRDETGYASVNYAMLGITCH